MIGEKFLCVKGLRKGERFKVSGQDINTNTLSLENVISGESIEWDLSIDLSEFLITDIENGVFYDIRYGKTMLIDSELVYEDQGYYVHFNSKSRISYQDFLLYCRRILSFKIVRTGEYASILSYPDVLLIGDMLVSSAPKGYKEALLRFGTIYIEGFWIGTKKPCFIHIVTDGYLDW